MTKDEFDAWTSEMSAATSQWMIDPIHDKRHNDWLAYYHTGGGRGYYAWFNGGAFSIGTFMGAVPHIGEAMFHADHVWNSPPDDIMPRFLRRVGAEHLI